MELKDVILSTIEELEHSKEKLVEASEPLVKQTSLKPLRKEEISTSLNSNYNEKQFLESMRERTHVLFEGFQSPNNKNIEAKIDLTLNFLEYLLSSVETRLTEIEESK